MSNGFNGNHDLIGNKIKGAMKDFDFDQETVDSLQAEVDFAQKVANAMVAGTIGAATGGLGVAYGASAATASALGAGIGVFGALFDGVKITSQAQLKDYNAVRSLINNTDYTDPFNPTDPLNKPFFDDEGFDKLALDIAIDIASKNLAKQRADVAGYKTYTQAERIAQAKTELNGKRAAITERLRDIDQHGPLPKGANGKELSLRGAPVGTDMRNPNGIDNDHGYGSSTADKNSANSGGKGKDKSKPGEDRKKPIILDLSGDGIGLTEKDNSSHYFDLAGTGYKQKMAWASVGNGVLAIDADGDGEITERKEIVFTDWDPNAADDMAALRSVFDTDNDGFLTSADARFGDFRLVVTNADGTTSVKTLTELGITSIKLTTDSTSYTLPDGSSIDGMTTFTRLVDGVETIGKAAAVTLAADAQGYAIDSETKINLDNSTTISNKARNADGSLASVTVTTTSEDGLSRTITFDNNGDGVIDRIQSWTKVENQNGSKTETVINKNGGGVLLDRTETNTSADGNTISISRDTRGGGYFNETETRVFGQGGGLTIVLSKLNPNGSLINSKSVTTTSDGLTRTESYDLDGSGSTDLIVKDETAIHDDKSRTEIVTRTSGNGTLLDRTVTEIDPTGQNRTVTTDADGDGDVDSIATVNVVDYLNGSNFALPNGGVIALPANSAVTTETTRNGDNSLSSVTKTAVSADSLTTITQVDANGDGVFELTRVDVTVLAGNGDRTQTISQYNADGSLQSKQVIFKDADGRGRNIQTDSDGNDINNSVETIVIDGDGISVNTRENKADNGTLISKRLTTTSADGLIVTTKSDSDGNGSYETVSQSQTVQNQDSSSTVTKIVRNADNSLRGSSVTTTSGDGMAVSVASDLDGDGDIDQTLSSLTVLNNDGSYVKTTTTKFYNNALGSLSTTTTSADRDSIVTATDANGDGAIDQTQSIIRELDGDVVDTLTNKASNGIVINRTVTTTSANGLSKSMDTDLNGDGIADRISASNVALNADGSRTETANEKAANGAKITEVITTVSGNGLSTTTVTDLNGDAAVDLTTTDATVLSANGSRTRTISNFNNDGSKQSELVTTISDDKLSVKTTLDINGDNVVDLTTIDNTTLNANGSATRKVTNTDSHGLRDQTITTTSADGKSITQETLTYGSVNTKQTYTQSVEQNGNVVGVSKNLSSLNALLNSVTTTTSANGLVVTAATDQNGDGITDYSSTSVTKLNDDGSTTKIVSSSNASGLIAKSEQSVSGNGLKTTSKIDKDGNNIFELTQVSEKVLNDDGSVTETVTETNADNSNRLLTVTQNSADGKTVTVTTSRGGVVAQKLLSQEQVNGDVITTLSSFDLKGLALTTLVTTTSANGLSKTVQLVNANGSIADTKTTQKSLNLDGSVTERFAQKGAVSSNITTTTSANDLATSIRAELDGQVDKTLVTDSVTALQTDGSRVQTISSSIAGTALKSKSVTSTSDDGLVTSQALDLNGDEKNEVTASSVTGADGSKTITMTKQSSGTGQLLLRQVTSVSADGRTTTVERDSDGNGTFDQIEKSVKNADGSVTTTRKGTGVAGTAGYYEVTTTSTNLDGGTSQKKQRFDDRGIILDGATTTVSANGLSSVTYYDTNGDNVTDQIETETTTLNADGSQSRVNEFRYSAGVLKARTVTTTSADGATAIVTLDNDGNGITERSFTLTTAPDGSRVTTVVEFDNKTGAQVKQTIYTTRADEMEASYGSSSWSVTSLSTKKIVDPGSFGGRDGVGYIYVQTVQTTTNNITFLDTATEFANANGSYQWVRTNNGALAGSTMHVIDASGIETWSWNIDSPTLWTQTTSNLVLANSGSIQIDVATKEKYLKTAENLYATLLDRNMLGEERELLAQYIQNGIFNQKLFVKNILDSAEFTAKYGSLTPAAKIDIFYKNALGDWRSSLAQAEYLSKVTAGNMTLEEVAIAVAQNAGNLDIIRSEYRNGVSSNTASYATSLGRVTAYLASPASNAGEAVGDLYYGVANLIGSAFNDTLVGDGNNNILVGGAGADALTGGAGVDTASYELSKVGVSVNLTTGKGLGGDAEGDTLATIENLTGSAFNDTLVGTSGDNLIKGGAGADSLTGGGGNDTVSYEGSNAGVTVNLMTGSGSGGDAQGDQVIGFTHAIGSSYNDYLVGTNADNRLDGGAGNDKLQGGLGNDTYVVDSADDVIVEGVEVGAGTADLVQSTAASYTLSANVENLTLMGVGNINGTGNASVNVITGNDGANVLDGGVEVGAVNDTLKGGKGDDTYILRNAGDIVTELTAEGTDTIDVRFDNAIYTMANYVENLVIGAGVANNFAMTGNALDNKMIGNELANTLSGGTGNDILIGGGGADKLTGGAETLDLASYETSKTGLTADLAVIANNTGDAAGDTYTTIDGLIGSAFNDTLRGDDNNNRLDGGAGNDTLEGGKGIDTLDGGAGSDLLKGGLDNDIYLVDSADDVIVETADGGTLDLVQSTASSYVLSANVENLTLMGAGNINGTGNASVNVITGNDGTNVLDGGIEVAAANDTLKGGKGDDTYIVRNAGDIVTELTAEGTDTIDVRFDNAIYTMANYVENLVIGAGVANNFAMTGNALDNKMVGNELANTLSGGTGNDILIGGGGADKLTGGAETLDLASYETSTSGLTADLAVIANNTGDAAGDTYTTIDGLIGSAFNDTLRGDDNANRLEGGAGNDTLEGGKGIDTLDGGLGNDKLQGGLDNDIYVVDSADDVIVETADGGTLDSVQSTAASYTLSTNLENLTLIGTGNINGTGNASVNVITGNDGANILDGGVEVAAANDTLKGGKGDDTYILRNTGDIVTELTAEGTDTIDVRFDNAIYTMANYVENLVIAAGVANNFVLTGNALDNKMVGNELANSLSGGTGNDILIGGGGADKLTGGAETLDLASYETSKVGLTADLAVIANNTGDAAGDTYTTIDGLIGSAFNDTLRGDDNNNRLDGGAGNDTLEGGKGIDTLDGGAGNDKLQGGLDNDIYVVDSADDVIIENAEGGTLDLVQSTASSYMLSANVENLTLMGAGNINGTGNASVNAVTGNDGANILDGGVEVAAANDTLKGGKGDDTYILRNAGDIVTELTAEGTDTIDVRFDNSIYTMANYVENLVIGVGVANNFVLTGNALDNKMIGNELANTLSGGAGNDILIGGAGADQLNGDAGTADFASYETALAGVNAYLNNGNSKFNTGDAAGDKFSGIEGLIGSAFNDTFTGDTLANTLIGGQGNDTLYGGDGNDRLLGEDGDDVLVGGAGADIISGGLGSNTLSYESSYAGGVTINLTSGTASGSDAEGDTFTSIEHVIGSGLNDVITGNQNANQLMGGSGNDTLNGGDGNDILDGGADNDVLDGGDGDDILEAGYGSDLLKGGNGNDKLKVKTSTGHTTMEGGAGDDILEGGWFGNDILDGGDDNDILNGSAGNDDLKGGNGADILDGGSGNDIMSGGSGNDIMEGGQNNDIMDGGGGNDILNGGTGNDIMDGGEGDDILDGSMGNNILQGGSGYDVISGGYDSNEYRFGRGSEVDIINAQNSNYDNETLAVLADVEYDQLWFAKSGNDLVVSIIGTNDVATIQGWYASNDKKLDSIILSGGKSATASNVELLREAMASFNPPPLGQLNMDDATKQALAPTLAAAWA